MRSRPLQWLARLAVILALVTAPGCDLLKRFKSDKKEVLRRIDRMKAALNRNDWEVIFSQFGDEFAWIADDGRSFQNKKDKKGKIVPTGNSIFRQSMDGLPKNRLGLVMKVEAVKKASDTKYFALVETTLRVRADSGDGEAIAWKSQHTWRIAGDNVFLDELKDLGPKKSIRGTIFNTNPAPPAKKGAAPRF